MDERQLLTPDEYTKRSERWIAGGGFLATLVILPTTYGMFGGPGSELVQLAATVGSFLGGALVGHRLFARRYRTLPP